MNPTLSEQPVDLNSKPMTGLDATRARVAAILPDFMRTERLRELHKKWRTQSLARKMHSVGPATLPLPNLAAFTEIQRLEQGDDPYAYLAECIFILSNQQDEDKLYLTGVERRRAIIAACKHIHAHNAHHYATCIHEMLEEIKKKHISSTARMHQETVDLTRRISSLLSANPSETPIATT